MLIASIRRNSVALAAFALLTSGILATTQLSTRERIIQAERAAAEKALLEIVPRHRHDNNMLDDRIPVPEKYWVNLGLDNGGDIHIARSGRNPEAVIIPAVAADGYSGDIKMIIGVNMDGAVAGVRVLSHRETPGLGDRMELKKSDWILSFNGKSLRNPEREKWAVKKDKGAFDQFTGATITPRAVVRQVRQALEVFDEAGPGLFSEHSGMNIKQDASEKGASVPQKVRKVTDHG